MSRVVLHSGLAVRVLHELARAEELFPPLHSPHEALAVIEEEFLELQAEVYASAGLERNAFTEAIQLAAMALRYVADLEPQR